MSSRQRYVVSIDEFHYGYMYRLYALAHMFFPINYITLKME